MRLFNENREIQMKLSKKELRIILHALMKLPESRSIDAEDIQNIEAKLIEEIKREQQSEIIKTLKYINQ
jgi:hypothetical protein